MSANYYLGVDPNEVLGDSPRYFYGMRKNQDGELFLVRSDQLKDTDSIELNISGSAAETFQDFEAGINFLDGIDADHNVVFDNLKYPQYKWDDRPLFYYIDSQGQLVIRINRGFIYPEGISSNG